MPTVNYPQLQQKLDVLPTRPGCYIYKDAAGAVIYVGKAINLRNRVRSYFQKSSNHAPKTRRLVDAVRDVEIMVVETELEALVLECNLIKKHRPYYNVRLRDDKHYPYICITTSENFPRMLLTRRVKKDGNKYFGPYTSSRIVWSTIDLMKKVFPLVSCGKSFTGEAVQKPCLYYHMGQCLAPCAGLADRAEYGVAIKNVISFLEGKQEQIIRDLRKRMEAAAEALEFERAAKLRDQVQAIEEVLTRQKVISTQMIDQDVVALVSTDDGTCVQMFYIRGGKLLGQNNYVLEGADEEEPGFAVTEFIKQYYRDAPYVPQEILLPCDIEETAIVQQWLRQKRGSKVEITVPVRGDKKRLVEMATENAHQAMDELKSEMRSRLGNRQKALHDLAVALGLESDPKRIECYDISNFQADHFVGSMVVCAAGEMANSEYRRFKIKFHENKPDDFAMMREVITRRLGEFVKGNPKFLPLPELIIVDGGKGQVTAAMSALSEVMATSGDAERVALSAMRIVGLAKKFELLILPDKPDPVVLDRASQSLYLVQRIRDEAHRFANAYRKTVQSKKQTHSLLDDIVGIGPVRRKALLKRFTSLEGIRAATIEDLCRVPGMNRIAALAVQEFTARPED